LVRHRDLVEPLERSVAIELLERLERLYPMMNGAKRMNDWNGRLPGVSCGGRFYKLHISVQYVQFIDGGALSMKSLSFTEFRKRASEILTLVEKGETVRVIRHGKTVAKIVPAETEEKIPSWKQPASRLIRPAASLSKAILEERRKSR
jgi:prevent-host-death family protein